MMEVELWEYADVAIKTVGKMVGGWPKNPQMVEALLRARGLEDLIPPMPDPATLTPEEAEAAKEAAIEKSWTGFKSNGNGIYIESRHVKAMFKEAANILKNILKVKNMRSKLAERVFIEPTEIYLGAEPDGMDHRFIHVMTARGPRAAMKFFDYVEDREFSFRVKKLAESVITWDHVRTLLEYAQTGGLGADRSQDFGHFEIVKFERA